MKPHYINDTVHQNDALVRKDFWYVLVEKIYYLPVQRHLKFSQVLGQMSENSSTTTLPTWRKKKTYCMVHLQRNYILHEGGLGSLLFRLEFVYTLSVSVNTPNDGAQTIRNKCYTN